MATTFHLFPHLPFELRAQIWESTVEPRTVEVRVLYTTTYTTSVVPRSLRRPWRGTKEVTNFVSVPRVTSPTPVPAALKACREARNMGLYKRAFAELSPEEPRYVWLNLDIDMVSIGTDPFIWFKPVAHLVRRLRFERKIGCEFYNRSESHEIGSFVNLDEIHVLCPESIEAWHRAKEQVDLPCGAENLYFIGLNDGRMMRSTELDEMCDKQLAAAWAEEGYNYYTGERLEGFSSEEEA